MDDTYTVILGVAWVRIIRASQTHHYKMYAFWLQLLYHRFEINTHLKLDRTLGPAPIIICFIYRSNVLIINFT